MMADVLTKREIVTSMTDDRLGQKKSGETKTDYKKGRREWPKTSGKQIGNQKGS